jgi:hypothetical protein
LQFSQTIVLFSGVNVSTSCISDVPT